MRTTIGALALLLLVAGAAAAQDEKDYPDERDPLIPPVKPKAEGLERPQKPADERPEEPRRDEPAAEKEEKLDWHLRFKWSHWNLEVTDVHVGAGRKGGSPSGASSTIGLAAAEREDADGFQLAFDAGQWVSLEATFRQVVARGGELAPRDFDLRGHTFKRDEVIDTKLEFITTDLDFVFKPVHGELGHLDVIGGLRYLGTWARVQDAGGPNRASQSVEALVPVIGVGGSLHLATEKKILAFEPYARALVGGMRFDAGQRYRAFTLSVEAGARFLIAEVIGVELGYRYELGHLDRGGGATTRTAHWRAGGMITGIVLRF